MAKQNQSDIKSSTTNLVLNILIFLLSAVIIYMTYSIAIKVFGSDTVEKNEQSTEVASDIIQVQVQNGCGVSGVADRFTDYLRNNGFDVVDYGNYHNFNVTKTMVVDRIGNLANARKVAESLGIKKENVFQQLNDDYFIDVSVIIGKDYYGLAPLK